MHSRFLSVLLTLALPPAVCAAAASEKNCGCDCCKGQEVCCCTPERADDKTTAKESPRHALRGVIVAIGASDATLTVKHEAIPGVMPAMTMVFKVEPAVTRSVKQGDAIAAQMSRIGEDWWLHEVKPAAKKP